MHPLIQPYITPAITTKTQFCSLKNPFVVLWLILSLSLFSIARAEPSSQPPYELPPRKELNKLKSAILFTSKGNIFFELYPEDAPWHVANFKYLADKGFYNKLRFHLGEPDQYIQAGAPTSNPNSGPGWSLPAEFSQHRIIAGALVMARFPDPSNPSRDSHGSQFFIPLKDAPKMNGNYTIFGQVIAGMEVVQKLEKGDLIYQLKVYVREN